MKPKEKLEIACAILHEPNSPYNKAQLSNSLGFSRTLWYYGSTLEPQDKAIEKEIQSIYEIDDTLGHKKLAGITGCSKNKILRIMHKYGLSPRKKKNKYYYPGKASTVFENLANEASLPIRQEIIFSDIFEFKLMDGSKVRGCFALRKKTRQILSLCFDYGMRSSLVIQTINRIDFSLNNPIWHSDQGRQYGSKRTINNLLNKGFIQSMSRAGTPTDNPFAERFVKTFKLAVVYRERYETLGQLLYRAEKWINFYNNVRPHEGIDEMTPNKFAMENNLKTVPYITL
ncbi:MAG: IS3 family transposase [Nanoarchaeota archaeon]